MTRTMTVAGYLWTGVLLLACLVVCLDYARRRWKARRERKRAERAALRNARYCWEALAAVQELRFDCYPRPLGAVPLVDGHILESRFTIHADSPRAAIDALVGPETTDDATT